MLFYRDDEGFLAGLLPFIREGLERDEAVIVAEPRPRMELLRDALGDDAVAVSFLDMAEIGANPARIIGVWAAALEKHTAAGQRLRGIGEPAFHGRRELEFVECQLHEQLLNHAFDGGPAWRLLCPYDEVKLPRAVVRAALHTHPIRSTVADRLPSDAYARDGHLEAFAAPLPKPTDAVLRGIYGPADVPATRRTVAQYARRVRPLRGAGRGPRAGRLGAGHQQHPLRRGHRDAGHVARARRRGHRVQRRRPPRRPAHRPAQPRRWTPSGAAASTWCTSCATWCRSGPPRGARRCAFSPGSDRRPARRDAPPVAVGRRAAKRSGHTPGPVAPHAVLRRRLCAADGGLRPGRTTRSRHGSRNRVAGRNAHQARATARTGSTSRSSSRCCSASSSASPFPEFAVSLKWLGTAFVALIRMLIAPVIFCTIVLGIGAHPAGGQGRPDRRPGAGLLHDHVDGRAGHRAGGRATSSTRASGLELSDELRGQGSDLAGTAEESGGTVDFLLGLIPTTLLSALTDGSVLQALLVALLVGFAIQAHGPGRRAAAARRRPPAEAGLPDPRR